MEVIELDTLPDLGPLLARAGTSALPSLDSLPWRDRSRRRDAAGDDGRAAQAGRPTSATAQAATPGLPPRQVVVHDVAIDLDAVADYASVCGFLLSSDIPITFPHVMGFPLSVWLMTRDDFPHDLLGLVHTRNQVVARDHLQIGSRIDLAAHVVNERSHPRGVVFDAVLQVRNQRRVVWASTSTYLRRGAPAPTTPESPTTQPSSHLSDPRIDRPTGQDGPRPSETGADAVDLDRLPTTATWSVPADIGRRYAAVSGDRNPIHLSAVTAKPFGFPRAIAHGMWTKAAALAALGTLPRPSTIDVVFQRPVLLPSTVEYATQRTAGGWEFGLRGRDGTPHLRGRVT